MSINTFDDLLSHAGHKIECVYYGTEHQAVNTALECITCGQVLIDLSPGQTVGVDDNDGTTIAYVWSVEDVMMRARKRHINLSDQQCLEILSQIDQYKDANFGSNDELIDTNIDMYLHEVSNVDPEG